jgi:hypothetical protein
MSASSSPSATWMGAEQGVLLRAARRRGGISTSGTRAAGVSSAAGIRARPRQIIALAQDFRDPRRRRICRPRPQARGSDRSHLDEAPAPTAAQRADRHLLPRLGSQLMDHVYRYSGMHRDDGLLFMRGPMIKPVTGSRRAVRTCADHPMGDGLPVRANGRQPLADAFTAAFAAEHPVTTTTAAARSNAAGLRLQRGRGEAGRGASRGLPGHSELLEICVCPSCRIARRSFYCSLARGFRPAPWNIEAQSIWGDEAFSIFTANRHRPCSERRRHAPAALSFPSPLLMEGPAYAVRPAPVSVVVPAGVAAGCAGALARRCAHRADAALIAISRSGLLRARDTHVRAGAALCAPRSLFLRWLKPSRGALHRLALATLPRSTRTILRSSCWRTRPVCWQFVARAAEGGQGQALPLRISAFGAGVALAYLPWCSRRRLLESQPIHAPRRSPCKARGT